MNYIPQIAKMLGVEINEEFDILKGTLVYYSGCCFTDKAFTVVGLTEDLTSDALMRILDGRWQVKKLPWKPKKGDSFFMPGIFGGIAVVEDAIWNENKGDDEIDERHYNAGLVCRTREEAMAKAKTMLEVAKCQHDKHC